MIDKLHSGVSLGRGCFSQVFESKTPGWVVKYGENDGTRTYLEWCKRKQDAGEGMKGMPKVDFVVDAPPSAMGYKNNKYIAALEKLHSPVREYTATHGYDTKWTGWHLYGFDEATYGPAMNIKKHPSCPEYIKELISAFERETGKSANDMHLHNVMVREDGTLVVTDPSSTSYEPHPGDCPVRGADANQLEMFARG